MASNQSAQIGANFSDYTGNAGLGDYSGGAFNIDTKPLQDLAAYTFLYHKYANDQKQKDVEAKAKEYASLTSYNLASAIPKFSNQIRKEYNDFYSWVQEHPSALLYKENENDWLEYNKRKSAFENNLSAAKTQDTIYAVRQTEIDKATTPEMKDYLKKNLDTDVDRADLNTPLPYTKLWNVAPVTVEPPADLKLDVNNLSPNFIATRTYTIPDMSSARQQARTKALGLSTTIFDENSIDFKSKPPELQKLIKDQFLAQSASGKLEPVESANIVSSILKDTKYQDTKFKNSDGTLNLDAVIKDNASNGIVSGVLSSIKQFNDKMDEMTHQIKSGAFTDKLKQPLKFGVGGLNENDWEKIDLSDGLTPDELLTVRITGLAKPISYATKIDQTNEAITAGHLNETIRHNKATEFLDSAKQKSDEDKWKASVTGSSTQANGAIERAKRIYADLLKLADAKGVITPDKIRQLNVEQLKYLGIEQPEERDPSTGVITVKGGFRPLDLTVKDEDGKVKLAPYVIQLVDGQVRVLSNPVKGKGDYYTGQFDPTKSTNLYNIGTNILNEELQKAGSKELNSYMGIDVTGGVTQTTEGGGTSVSGSTKTSISNSEPISLTGKIDMNTLQIGQPYSVSGKIYIWDGKKLKPQ